MSQKNSDLLRWLRGEGFEFTGFDRRDKKLGLRVDAFGIGRDLDNTLVTAGILVKDKAMVRDVGQSAKYLRHFRLAYLAVDGKRVLPEAVVGKARECGLGLLSYQRGKEIEVVARARMQPITEPRLRVVSDLSNDELTVCRKCKELNFTDDLVHLHVDIPGPYRGAAARAAEPDLIELCEDCTTSLRSWLQT